MAYTVLVSRTFQHHFNQLPKKNQNQIRNTLHELQIDPYTHRPKCDIKELKSTKPKKHRLRIGDYRVIYCIENKTVKIIDLIKREVGYNKID
ncbi:MAG: type II toxin-antitoxin system RelE/ParE family toxin [Candidatus Thermoplasmatota archaeon]|nr:type II toxin-antitoxin system RelE/ParE family toxin [Candidatus Thermoplasmatota archaeon]